jgi:hypothetical protein
MSGNATYQELGEFKRFRVNFLVLKTKLTPETEPRNAEKTKENVQP